MRLGDLGVFKSGGTPSRSKKEYWGGEYPWISSTALGATYIDEKSASDWVSEEGLRRSATKLIKANSVMVGIRVGVGKCAINSVPMCTSQDVVSIEDIDEEQYDLPYLLALINSKRSYFESIKRGATIQGITTGDIQSIPVPNIKKAEQKKISDMLENVGNMEKLYRKQLAALDALVKSRFIEMFGDPVTNPMGWDVKKLSDICTVGSSKRVYQSEQTTTGVPFLRISDLVSRITSQEESCDLHISEGMFSDFEQQGLVPNAGDILVTARGTLGLCYIIKPGDRFYFQDGMISWVHTSEAEVNPVYISYLFDSQGIRRQIDSVIAGSTVAYLSIAQLGKFDILMPPIALQNQFADFVALADKSKLTIQKSIEDLHTLKAKLMQEYFG